jgi:enolase-phosphatase E1
MERIACRGIVVDIEGTTSAARHVYEVLFPYARAHMRDWLAAHGSEPETAGAVAEVASSIGADPGDLDAVTAQLIRWIDDDVKAAPLKTIQGLIWEEGYARGELTSHMFDDVPPALRAWKEAGFVLAVYSSGSVAAQQALVANAPQGDLRPLFTGYFDITTAGAKREPSSYRRIAVSLGIDPAQLLFLSDVQAELDAARVAGWQTVGLLREGETQATATAEPTVASFDDIEVVPA